MDRTDRPDLPWTIARRGTRVRLTLDLDALAWEEHLAFVRALLPRQARRRLAREVNEALWDVPVSPAPPGDLAAPADARDAGPEPEPLLLELPHAR